MPEGVTAQLEAVVRQPFDFLQAPLPVLAAELRAVAEEIVTGRASVQHAKRRAVAPPGMRLREVEPDANAARRIDLQLPIILDVAELLRRRVIEDKDDR